MQHHRHIRHHHHAKHYPGELPVFRNATIPTSTVEVSSLDAATLTSFITTATSSEKTNATKAVKVTSLEIVDETSTSASPTETASPPAVSQADDHLIPPSKADKSWRAVLCAGCVLFTALCVCLYAWYAIKKKEKRLAMAKEQRRLDAIREKGRVVEPKGGLSQGSSRGGSVVEKVVGEQVGH
ncbi:Hypothetical protein D9617_133g098310 [Elsinoe fawcettii]|nr:Hypothetical protein D9617_133g098310 [Elsinoe fawcettii]